MASLEAAVLDVSRPRRAFRRLNRSALESLLQDADSEDSEDAEAPDEPEVPESNGDSSN